MWTSRSQEEATCSIFFLPVIHLSSSTLLWSMRLNFYFSSLSWNGKPGTFDTHLQTWLLLCISNFSWSTVFLSSGYYYCKFDLCVLNPGLYLLDPNLSPDTNPILIFTSWFSLLLLFLVLCYIYWLTAFYDLPMSAHEGQHNRED